MMIIFQYGSQGTQDILYTLMRHTAEAYHYSYDLEYRRTVW